MTGARQLDIDALMLVVMQQEITPVHDAVQEAIDKGAFRTKGTIYEGAPNMLNVLRTAIEIAGAMSYLHSLDILHSDLNGNNILLISNTGIDDRPFSVKVAPRSVPSCTAGVGCMQQWLSLSRLVFRV